MFDPADIITAFVLGMAVGFAGALAVFVTCAGKTADRRRTTDYRRLASTQRALADARQSLAREHLGTPYREQTVADAELRHRDALDAFAHAIRTQSLTLGNDDHSKSAELRRSATPALTLVDTTEGVTA